MIDERNHRGSGREHERVITIVPLSSLLPRRVNSSFFRFAFYAVSSLCPVNGRLMGAPRAEQREKERKRERERETEWHS